MEKTKVKGSVIIIICIIFAIIFSIKWNINFRVNNKVVFSQGISDQKGSTGNINVMDLPVLTEPVTDFTNTLTVAQLSGLISISKDFEKKSTNQIVTVLIPDRQGNELFDIGMNIFKKNKFGQKDKNNGILLVIAVNEKKIRIVTGYGVESIIPDTLASDVIEKYIRPEVNAGNLYQGILNYYTYSIKAFEGNYKISKNNTLSNSTYTLSDRLKVVFVILFFVIWIMIFFRGKRGPYGGSGTGWSSSSKSSSSSSSGGGGRSGGGGSSGGGGAGD